MILREISHSHIQTVLVDALDLERSCAACAKVHGESRRGVCDQIDIAHKPCRFVCRPHICLAERVFLRQYLNGTAGFSCRTDGKGRVLGCVNGGFLRVLLRDCIRCLDDDGLSFQAAVCEVGILGSEIYLVRTNVRKGWCIAAFAEFYRAVFVRHIHRAVRISRPNRPQHEIAVLFSFERDFRRRFSIDRCAVAQDSDSRTVCADAAACRKANTVSGVEIGRSCSERRFHADRACCTEVDVLARRDCAEYEILRVRLLQINGRLRVRFEASAKICLDFSPFPADVAFAAVKRQVFRRDASFCRDAVSCQQLDFVRSRVDAAFDAQRLALGACQIDVSRAVCRDAAVRCRLHRERCLLPHGQTDESAGCVIVLRDIARSRFRERLEVFRAREVCFRNGLFPGRTDIFRVQHDAAAADVRRFLKVHFARTAVDDSIFHSVEKLVLRPPVCVVRARDFRIIRDGASFLRRVALAAEIRLACALERFPRRLSLLFRDGGFQRFEVIAAHFLHVGVAVVSLRRALVCRKFRAVLLCELVESYLRRVLPLFTRKLGSLSISCRAVVRGNKPRFLPDGFSSRRICCRLAPIRRDDVMPLRIQCDIAFAAHDMIDAHVAVSLRQMDIAARRRRKAGRRRFAALRLRSRTDAQRVAVRTDCARLARKLDALRPHTVAARHCVRQAAARADDRMVSHTGCISCQRPERQIALHG